MIGKFYNVEKSLFPKGIQEAKNVDFWPEGMGQNMIDVTDDTVLSDEERFKFVI